MTAYGSNNVQHVTVFRAPGRYAGWPANYGIWSWDSEIVVGFTLGYHQTGSRFHTRDKSRPFVTMQARSRDGGRTWNVGPMPCKTPGSRGLSADEHMDKELGLGVLLDYDDSLADAPGGIDFAHPDFALLCARTGLQAGVRSFFYTSTDRCHSWEGPYRLPMYGQTGIAARTDYLVSGPRECTLFLTANKQDGEEGRVFCVRSTDGGASFHFLAWIGPELPGYHIMPASVRLSATRILVAVRCRDDPGGFAGARHWIDLYASGDDGKSWFFFNRPVPDTGRGGNPPALTRLGDGRLCLTYGYRAEPFGVRARFSGDGGVTWSEEIVLRNDGGCHDLGYPRTVQRPDGTLVTVYYFNDEPDGERYIAATLWRP
jgi:hypothetical protein